MSDVFRMDGSNSGYSYYASANFGNAGDDIGGEFTSSSEYVSMKNCIENLVAASLNIIEEETVNKFKNGEKDDLDRIFKTFSNIKSKLISL